MSTVSHSQENTQMQLATFAGGCFWCIQHDYKDVPGIIESKVGYAGGTESNPSYEQVSSGKTGHIETLQLQFDPNKVTYQQLLEIFWRNIDPTRDDGQFCDSGNQYRAVIFYHSDEQQQLAEASKQALIDSKRFSHVLTDIRSFSTFYHAEDYHQRYSEKNPVRYKLYRFSCGRDKRLKELWGE